MHATPATSSTNLSIPTDLKEKVNVNLRRLANESLLQRQLYLRPPGHVPKELQTTPDRKAKKIEKTNLSDKAHESLSLPDKISVLMRSIGFLKTCQVLDHVPAAPSDPKPEDQVERMNEYQAEIAEWTEGIVTCHQLNSLRALRMLLFAALDNCCRLEDVKTRENVLVLRTAFQATFLLIDRCSSSPEKMSFILQGIAKNLDSLAAYRSQIIPDPKQEHRDKQLQENAERIQLILTLLLKGFRDPVHLMPILFHPLKTQPVSGANDTDLIDYVGPKVSEWLIAFHRAFCFQSGSFPKILKEKLESKGLYRKNIGDFKAAEAAYNDLVARSQTLLERLCAIHQELQAYQKFTPARQRESVDSLTRIKTAVERLTDQLYKFNDCNRECRDKMEKLIPLCQGKLRFESEEGMKETDLQGWLEDEYTMSIHHPVNHMSVLFSFVNSSMHNSCHTYTTAFSSLEGLLTPRFKSLPHVTVVDLLSWQLQESTLTLLEKINRKQIPEEGNLIQNLQKFQQNLNAVFNAMRRYYHLRRHTQGRSLEDLDLDVQCHNNLAENMTAAQKILDQKLNPEVRKALETYKKASDRKS
ncbi:MAG: hypothetical protein LLG04_16530, partial [Parachlamydia sp.]|nr:hypothetical protein [Parachlamydia sp.]